MLNLRECFVTSIVGVVLVQRPPPQPFDRVQMRTIGGDEVQLDPALRPRQPGLHELRVMVPANIETEAVQRLPTHCGPGALRTKWPLWMMSCNNQLNNGFGAEGTWSRKPSKAAYTHCRC